MRSAPRARADHPGKHAETGRVRAPHPSRCIARASSLPRAFGARSWADAPHASLRRRRAACRRVRDRSARCRRPAGLGRRCPRSRAGRSACLGAAASAWRVGARTDRLRVSSVVRAPLARRAALRLPDAPTRPRSAPGRSRARRAAAPATVSRAGRAAARRSTDTAPGVPERTGSRRLRPSRPRTWARRPGAPGRRPVRRLRPGRGHGPGPGRGRRLLTPVRSPAGDR